MNADVLLPVTLAIPAIGAMLITLAGRWPNVREAVTLVTAVTLFVVVAALLPAVLDGARPSATLLQMLPGLPLQLTVEPLGMLFATVASGLWIINSIYSIGYMRANREKNQTRFYVCFAIALASTMGIAFAGNLLTLFIFYETLTLSTYPLVTHKGTPEAMRGGRTYLTLLLSTSIGLLLVAILWTAQLAGTLDFRIGGILAGKADGPVVTVLLALYIYGIGKAALMPIHRWLPAAMVAPAPVSALLHAVAVVKAGVFTVVKVIVYVFGLDLLRGADSQWLVYVAGTTVILASVVALQQDDLKRRLAYSTVSQLGYVVLAAALLTPLSIVGATVHIASHAFGKITLFFAAGAIYTAAHKTRVSELAGIGRRMPWTMGAFTIAAISMIGVPPTAGFVSKWYILQGAFQAEQPFAVAVIVISTVLNAAYFLPIVYTAFFRKAGKDVAYSEAPLPIVAGLAVPATLTIALFCFPEIPLSLARALMGITA